MKRIILTLLGIIIHCGLYSQILTLTQTIKTPNQSVVPDTYILTNGQNPVYTSTQLATLANHLYNNYDGATIIGEPDYRYNCHAYAWCISEGGDTVWIGAYTNTAEDIYWLDGSYIEVTEGDATKVSYHQSGNHSAIKEGEGWYRSKWGGSFLVRHKLNEVLRGDYVPVLESITNYHPEMPKKFYVRCPSIQGNSSPCGTEIYSINNLPNNAIVYWSFLSGSVYNSVLLQSNQPTLGQCTINIDNNENINDTLVAQVYGSGGLLCTLKKEINTGWNFSGTYTETGYSPLYSNVYNRPIHNKSRISAFPDYDIDITSNNFPNVILSHTASSLISWYYDGNTHILLHVSASANEGHTMKIVGTSNINNNCDDFVLNVVVSIKIFPPIILLSGNTLILTLDDENNDLIRAQMDGIRWRVDINSIITGKRKYMCYSNEGRISIDTSGWEPGIYSIRSVINDTVFTQKIVIN